MPWWLSQLYCNISHVGLPKITTTYCCFYLFVVIINCHSTTLTTTTTTKPFINARQTSSPPTAPNITPAKIPSWPSTAVKPSPRPHLPMPSSTFPTATVQPPWTATSAPGWRSMNTLRAAGQSSTWPRTTANSRYANYSSVNLRYANNISANVCLRIFLPTQDMQIVVYAYSYKFIKGMLTIVHANNTTAN